MFEVLNQDMPFISGFLETKLPRLTRLIMLLFFITNLSVQGHVYYA